MPTTERMKPISLFVPFEPVERRSSKSDPLIVSGYCFVNETVEGEGGIVIERAAMQAATPEYASRGTIREMHGPHAAGRADSVDWDPQGRCHIVARIVDPVAAMKCEEGVYRGFSIKVRPTQRLGNRVKALKWAENSLVDDPADPDCNELTLSRAEDFDPDAEIEVEVLDDTPSPAAAADPPDAAAAPDRVSLESQPTLPPPSSPAPSGGEAPPSVEPSSAQVPAEGASSHTEEQRAALLAAGLPEGMLAGVEVVAASDTERALGSPVVPIRENLLGQPTADLEDVDDALGGGLPGGYRVEQVPTGAWCAYGPAGDKLGEFETEAAARAHVAECVRQMGGVGAEDEPPTRAAAVAPERVEEISRELAVIVARATDLQREMAGLPVERVIKHEGDKWVVYSEGGKRLGEHDNEADAKDQLQAIEISKHKNDAGGTQPRVAAVEELPPAAPNAQHPTTDTQVSRTDVREETTDTIQRLETVTAELSRVQAAHEETLTRLASAEAEVQRLRKMPLDREKPVVRFPHALSREFIANLGNEGEAAINVLRADYELAKKEAEAERNGDRTKLNRATERMILRASQLAEHGIYVS